MIMKPARAQSPGSPLPSDSDAMTGELQMSMTELGASSERSLACSKQISAVAATCAPKFDRRRIVSLSAN